MGNVSYENEFCMQFHFMQLKVIFNDWSIDVTPPDYMHPTTVTIRIPEGNAFSAVFICVHTIVRS